ncbi:hypothetical protein [Marinobacter sp. BGYM27]|uniref:hypothetical protein n=1 Tax=Marinobacter sp. BGYM27 TaxID=2975597 RepID=UPI0021A6F1A3|nr:hypothetical protein [Marinobacter sp. BGYM27]MDG5498939.1 hypothetical protein [Marinobacter sp. BGYM27]
MDMQSMTLRMRVLYHQAAVMRVRAAMAFEMPGSQDRRALGERLLKANRELSAAQLAQSQHTINRRLSK